MVEPIRALDGDGYGVVHSADSVHRLHPALGVSVVIYSDRYLIGAGLLALLPEAWRSGSHRIANLRSLRLVLGWRPNAVIVDAAAADATEAADEAVAQEVPLLVLVDSPDQQLEPSVLQAVDAVLLSDELTPASLSLAMIAASHGMRLLPRSFNPPSRPPLAEDTDGQPSEVMLEALALLADGLRDAEIALELNLSESAARKLVQRAVRRLGARTRCEAVTKAIADGRLA